MTLPATAPGRAWPVQTRRRWPALASIPRKAARFAWDASARLLLPARLSLLTRRTRRHWRAASPADFLALRRRSLDFIARHALPAHGPGAYSYQAGGPPLLYASCYALLSRHLCGDLHALSPSDRSAWAHYLLSFQSQDGLFRDPLIASPLADTCDWWGWRHLTLHVLMALTALGAVAPQPFALPTQFHPPGALEAWLQSLDWLNVPHDASNSVQNLGTLLQYARDFQHDPSAQPLLDRLFTWLDLHQDPVTGLWGKRFAQSDWLTRGVQAGYHLWLLYLYDRRPPRHPEAILESCLATQNSLGGFGVGLNSSACEDIDSIDPIVRFAAHSGPRAPALAACLHRALFWQLANLNPDGGWVFKRHQACRYGHDLMTSPADHPTLFPTWFRLLSLAFLAQALPNHPLASLPWHFLDCPGHQFWRTP